MIFTRARGEATGPLRPHEPPAPFTSILRAKHNTASLTHGANSVGTAYSYAMSLSCRVTGAVTLRAVPTPAKSAQGSSPGCAYKCALCNCKAPFRNVHAAAGEPPSASLPGTSVQAPLSTHFPLDLALRKPSYLASSTSCTRSPKPQAEGSSSPPVSHPHPPGEMSASRPLPFPPAPHAPQSSCANMLTHRAIPGATTHRCATPPRPAPGSS